MIWYWRSFITIFLLYFFFSLKKFNIQILEKSLLCSIVWIGRKSNGLAFHIFLLSVNFHHFLHHPLYLFGWMKNSYSKFRIKTLSLLLCELLSWKMDKLNIIEELFPNFEVLTVQERKLHWFYGRTFFTVFWSNLFWVSTKNISFISITTDWLIDRSK